MIRPNVYAKVEGLPNIISNANVVKIEDPPEIEEIIYGWRVFVIGTDGYLYSPVQGTQWEGRELRADCAAAKHSSDMAWPKQPPKQSVETHLSTQRCTCGIYTYRMRPFWNLGIYEAVGLCVNYGVVERGVSGYRSEYTRIEKLYVPRGACDLIDSERANTLYLPVNPRFKIPSYSTGAVLRTSNPDTISGVRDPDIIYKIIARYQVPVEKVDIFLEETEFTLLPEKLLAKEVWRMPEWVM